MQTNMYTNITIEDVIANALIELSERLQKKEVYLYNLYKYIDSILNLLNSKEASTIFTFKSDRFIEFLHKYSNYFELFCNDTKVGIRLKDNSLHNDLIDKFRKYIPKEVLAIFISEPAFSLLIKDLQ